MREPWNENRMKWKIKSNSNSHNRKFILFERNNTINESIVFIFYRHLCKYCKIGQNKHWNEIKRSKCKFFFLCSILCVPLLRLFEFILKPIFDVCMHWFNVEPDWILCVFDIQWRCFHWICRNGIPENTFDKFVGPFVLHFTDDIIKCYEKFFPTSSFSAFCNLNLFGNLAFRRIAGRECIVPTFGNRRYILFS